MRRPLMPRVNLNFRKLSITDKIAKARLIVTALTNNAAFATSTSAGGDRVVGNDSTKGDLNVQE
jgi:hypothetical protein